MYSVLPTGILICCTSPFRGGTLCLFGFCLLSLRCLISALRQAGGGDLLFRLLVQFSPAAGRAGRCRQISLCVGSIPRVPATLGLPRSRVSVLSYLHCSGSRLLYMERALRWVRFQFSGTPQKHGFGCACILCLRRPERLSQPGAWWVHSPQMWHALSPQWPQPQFLLVPVGCQRLVFVFRSWPLVVTLDVDHPESQGVFG